MSRSQQNQTFNTAQGENQGYNANAQTSFNTAQQDIGNYEDQLAKFSSANPYVQGGEYQTATNQQLTNTADASGQSAGQALQAAAVRNGENPSAAIGATEAMQQENERNLSGQEASATQNRINSEAGYNKDVLAASQVPETMEAQLAQMQGQLAQGALGTQEQAAQTPSFLDELGNDLIGGGTAVGVNYAKGKLG